MGRISESLSTSTVGYKTPFLGAWFSNRSFKLTSCANDVPWLRFNKFPCANIGPHWFDSNALQHWHGIMLNVYCHTDWSAVSEILSAHGTLQYEYLALSVEFWLPAFFFHLVWKKIFIVLCLQLYILVSVLITWQVLYQHNRSSRERPMILLDSVTVRLLTLETLQGFGGKNPWERHAMYLHCLCTECVCICLFVYSNTWV